MNKYRYIIGDWCTKRLTPEQAHHMAMECAASSETSVGVRAWDELTERWEDIASYVRRGDKIYRIDIVGNLKSYNI